MAKKENIVFYGTGRRKNAIARVRLVEGTGKITINGKDIDEFFGLETLKVIVRQPLTVTNTTSKFDVIANVKGGGISGQAGAIRHGIARALNEANSEYRPALKTNGFLTRDPRMKERKKYGLKKLVRHLNLARDRQNFYTNKNESIILLSFFLLFNFSKLYKYNIIGDNMNSFKITTFVNNIANFLACSIQDTNTLALLAAIFTQLGDTLATILATKHFCDKQ